MIKKYHEELKIEDWTTKILKKNYDEYIKFIREENNEIKKSNNRINYTRVCINIEHFFKNVDITWLRERFKINGKKMKNLKKFEIKDCVYLYDWQEIYKYLIENGGELYV